jgi:NAD(P)-dependent dehydrogenase (short-subunit alcohol dehydrogenase family)
MMTKNGVAHKTVFVTGANRGLGKAIVHSALAHGAAKVYAGVRVLETAHSLVERYAHRVVPIEIDLTMPETLQAAAAEAADVDLLINNAGVLRASGPLDRGAASALRFEMEVNVFGFMAVAQAFAPVLKRNGGGAIVQINSVASMKCFSSFTTYCASKAAAYSVTQALRELLAGQGTTVFSVHPGPILTDMGRATGLADIAAPAASVAEAIVESIGGTEFHVFPDAVAQQIGSAYMDYAGSVIEGALVTA